jgi:hypothetical protein
LDLRVRAFPRVEIVLHLRRSSEKQKEMFDISSDKKKLLHLWTIDWHGSPFHIFILQHTKKFRRTPAR